MRYKKVLFVALCLGVTAFVGLSPAEAKLLASLKSVKLDAKSEDCCTPKPVCCPEPCITYRHCGPKLCCGCEPPQKIVLKVKNPCTGCEVDVPICLPACCKGEPKMCEGTGLFCRDVVDYEWCCGFQVKVVFRHCGDLIVKTWGY